MKATLHDVGTRLPVELNLNKVNRVVEVSGLGTYIVFVCGGSCVVRESVQEIVKLIVIGS